MTLIRGLLKALSTAHADKNTILFERVKTILAQLARQNQQQKSANSSDPKSTKEESKEESAGGEQCKVILSEMSQVMLKQHKDPVMQRTYSDCFILLTKHFYE